MTLEVGLLPRQHRADPGAELGHRGPVDIDDVGEVSKPAQYTEFVEFIQNRFGPVQDSLVIAQRIREAGLTGNSRLAPKVLEVVPESIPLV